MALHGNNLVEIDSGKLEGTIEDGLHVFKGITSGRSATKSYFL